MTTKTESKAVRATLTDEQLIDQFEKELYDKELSERGLISMALELYFSRKDMEFGQNHTPSSKQ